MLQMQRGRCCRGVAVHCHANMHVAAFNMHVGIASMRNCVGAVYYKQIRKSEQRPPLYLRTADLVPHPRTPLCHTAIARCKLRQD